MTMPTKPTLEALMNERILILDGAMGSMLQRYKLQEADFRGERFASHHKDVRGNSDLLNLTKPDVVREIHEAYLAVGVDMLETNTFTATTIAQADYELEHLAYELNVAGAKLAREAVDAWTSKDPSKPRYVIGSLGSLNRTLVAVARRQRSGLPRGHLRPGARRLCGTDPGTSRRRRRRHPVRDDHRHAECEGRPRRPRRGLHRARQPRTIDDQRHHDRRLGPHLVGPDARGLHDLGRARQAADHRHQLRAWAARRCAPSWRSSRACRPSA